MGLCCQQDDRRDGVRRMQGRNGLDYVEVSDDQRTLQVYFLGKLPPEFTQADAPPTAYLRIEGGQRITGIEVVSVIPEVDPDPENDDVLSVRVSASGDFSTYTLRLMGVQNIDPRYDSVDFSFKVNCPSDEDCSAVGACPEPGGTQPDINYLAKDYASFRQLILDRLAVLMPDWRERHTPDVMIALVEVLAYTGDYLSYYQDAVATEAYLDTARQRISVRRHGRLIDYLLHEGCNARAWICAEVSGDVELMPREIACITGLNDALSTALHVLGWEDLVDDPTETYEVFEPLVDGPAKPIVLHASHNRIRFHTWRNTRCCLERGSTSATLVDAGAGDNRALDLGPGDVLIFEEVLGVRTGLPADADPSRRHAVRLTAVSRSEDPLGRAAAPTPVLEIEWGADDALPFPFCLSTMGPAPECRYIEDITIARGNVILVDHGRTVDDEPLGSVSTGASEQSCECAGRPGEIEPRAAMFRPALRHHPVTFSEALPVSTGDGSQAAAERIPSAAALMRQDVRRASAQVWLTSDPPQPWTARADLIGSAPSDPHFVVEVDNERSAHLRFGDGELGLQPPAGLSMSARYRVGSGTAGNVGAEAIGRLVVAQRLSGVSISIRNPIAAVGGADPEPIAEAKLFAPHAFRTVLDRAVIAADYAEIAMRDDRIQRASADLVWSGSWYEAVVAIDPRATTREDQLAFETKRRLARYRRMGHDLAAVHARYVPLHLRLEVCALPYHERGRVKAALFDVFSARDLAGGGRGFFHPDNLTFGEGIYVSRIVAAAQQVAGVECARVTRLHRLFESPNQEIENGVLPLRGFEIAQLDSDPSFPERGLLDIAVSGGK